jgi:hypothetical protein
MVSMSTVLPGVTSTCSGRSDQWAATALRSVPASCSGYRCAASTAAWPAAAARGEGPVGFSLDASSTTPGARGPDTPGA